MDLLKVKGTKGNRMTRKQEQRKKLYYALKINSIVRSTISQQEAACIFDDIYHDRQSRFSVKKLSAINIDVEYDIPTEIKLKLGCTYSVLLNNLSRCTFLFLSSLLCRDIITASLLNANAQFTYCKEYSDSLQYLLKHEVPISFAINIINIYTHSLTYDCSTGVNTGGITGADGDAVRCVLYPCMHTCSSDEFWCKIVLDCDKYRDLTCHICDTSLTTDICSSDPISKKKNKVLDVTTTAHTDTISTATAVTSAGASLERYNMLPLTDDIKDSKVKFKAHSYAFINRIYLGASRSKRNSELEKAVTTNNIDRVANIIEAGADVNCTNEYGQTALCIACWLGHTNIVKLLMAVGADVDAHDYNGHTCIDVACSNNHNDILDIVRSNYNDNSKNAIPSGHIVSCMNLCNSIKVGTVEVLVDHTAKHAGAGSYVLDNFFPDEYIDYLQNKYTKLPTIKSHKETCSDRAYYCDTIGDSLFMFEKVLTCAASVLQASDPTAVDTFCRHVMPGMRYLSYVSVGSWLPPHIDLRKEFNGVNSTHTFILYLSDCKDGGETVLLHTLNDASGDGMNSTDDSNVLAIVKPKRNRLFFFPHMCPHRADKTVEVPKLLLRGEMY